jgi:hypothetical protein
MGSGVGCGCGRIQEFKFFKQCLISEVTGKISLRSTSGAGLLKSIQSASRIASWWELIQFKSLSRRSFRSTSVEVLQAIAVGSWLAKSSAGEGRKSESWVMARGLESDSLVKVASFKKS